VSADKFYRCLANETRLRCLILLSRGERCVCDIAAALAVSQPMISRHLAQLRACHLVSDHREGQWVYYRLHPQLAQWQQEVLQSTVGGLGATTPFRNDIRRLQDIERNKQQGDCR